MPHDPRLPRRIVGLLRARLPELGLEAVADPRARRGRRWASLPAMLRVCLVGMMAGRKSFAELEALSDEMALPLRRELGVTRRLPDTTLRTTLCRLSPDALRRCLHAQAKAAHRRKALEPLGLLDRKVHVVSSPSTARTPPSRPGMSATRRSTRTAPALLLAASCAP